MKKNRTHCYSYFAICSAGEIKNGIGFVAADNSDFDPNYITRKIGIKPYEIRKKGTMRGNGHGKYPFSEWTACYQDFPTLDAEEQCVNIVRALKDKTMILLEIKREFNVTFSILIIPQIYKEETPILFLNEEIIEFCHSTKTEIGIDLYITN